MRDFVDFIKAKYSSLIIWLFIPFLIIVGFGHHTWVKPENVMEWDIKSYYAYLPALFIHGDLSLEFIKDNPREYNKWYWPAKTPTGKRCIITSMGLAFLYLPFFLIAHIIALVTPYADDGYSVPYAFMLHFSALLYFLAGLFCLRNLLAKYFNQLTAIITILIVFFSTNLFYYVGFEAAFAHSYNFALFCIFLYLADKWHDKPSIKVSVYLGLLSGLITLIRPTNIIILLFFVLWNVYSWSSLINKYKLLISKISYIGIMALCFFLVWVPQFLYWKYVSGQFIYYSYAGIDGHFFWDNPQIYNILFSFRKGWLVYTPIMVFAILGIVLLPKKFKSLSAAIPIFLLVNIYIQSSWFCWWFGGSYGLRAFVDSYGIMAIPLAAIIFSLLKYKFKALPGFIVLGTLVWYGVFQMNQYRHQAIHYWWMSYDAYWEVFLKKHPTVRYWDLIPVPDYPKARRGITVSQNLIKRYDGNYPITSEMIVHEIRKDVNWKDVSRGLKKRGAELHISTDSLMTIKAWNIYEEKPSLNKYIIPLEDSLKRVMLKQPKNLNTTETQ